MKNTLNSTLHLSPFNTTTQEKGYHLTIVIIIYY